MFINQKRILVEWGHCDPAGIVFYPRYLAWFDECTTALFAAAGLPTNALFRSQGIVGVPLVDLKVTFEIPSTYGDELLAESGVCEWRKSSFVVRHRFLKSGLTAVEGLETRVWTVRDAGNGGRLKSRPIPPEIVERLSRPKVEAPEVGSGVGCPMNPGPAD